MTDLMGSTAHELLAQVLARYGSIDVFIARLHALLDTPTVALPASASSADGRHRLAERNQGLELCDGHRLPERHGRQQQPPCPSAQRVRVLIRDELHQE
ncbi:hypothetical protein ACFXPS_42320 [Nocardia sp. NPDC059091]|uniref:hypothetical protein n=1 Tax=unclassified Nocardia TaxID=2637762 RepID=UPI003681B858